jgi:hypothetical protein
MRPAVVLNVVVVLAAADAAVAGGRMCMLQELARQAVSADVAVASAAISRLRAEGPDALDMLLNEHRDIIAYAADRNAPAELAGDESWKRLCRAIDQVSGQHDGWASRLYWYTDIEQAKAVAKAGAKPILSLRLLGNLTDEHSCANSRFFRTLLYANENVSKVLREQFVLHWQSLRPVPHVTIDFGDGRKIETTITGNSIHYVLDSDGNVIDGLPGLYGPAAFIERVLAAGTAAREAAKQKPDPARWSFLRDWHRGRLEALSVAWTDDLRSSGVDPQTRPYRTQKVSAGAPLAEEAEPVAFTKCRAEVDVLGQLRPELRRLTEVTDEAAWRRIALRHAANVALDARSRNLIRWKVEALQACSRPPVQQPAIEPVLTELTNNVAVDTVRNEYMLHRQIHEWLARAPGSSIEELNEWVYATLFLTPSSDPWLGLLPADGFNGLTAGGVVMAGAAPR